ncbi:reticulon-1-A-like [Xenia sp. Carnegie-2017]|uniref:reticulon-1-A-like n=1 Tax=Xenia sp. Carnegie-2017 TaxID=2897299 RepID=UPI001F046819|nr:reticulon-1-A-like [Xenia sp. Carnegie-2017]
MTVISALQKTDSRTSYQSFIEKNMTISPEKARGIGEAIGNKMNTVLMKVSKLFLVEDTMASIKFGIFLWFLSCVGKWFDTITLFMIGTVMLFSLPRLYEDNQKQVDEILHKVSEKLHQCFIMVKTKLESRFYQKEKTT